MEVNEQSNHEAVQDSNSQRIRHLTIQDLQDGIQVMSQAFLYDPLWVYLYKDERKRKKYLYQFFKAVLRLAIDKRQAYGIGYPVKGIAVWALPNKLTSKLSLHTKRELMKLGISPFGFKIRLVRDIFSTFNSMKKNHVRGSGYYLQSIGVKPMFQGKGYATKLIEPFVTKAKETGYEIYTETMTPENVGIYEHYGFNCVEKHHIHKKNLDIWAFYTKF